MTVGLLLAGVLAGGVTMTLGMLVHEASVLVVIALAMRLLRARPTVLADRRAGAVAAAGWVPRLAGTRIGASPR